ncbi:MAG: hemerythrin domain-containing protein [Candidatus Nanoarchaeia archaeon]|nr:hemerythrin domain-containing protein [Candidatus Nanoarchaeia archaeon]
MKPISLLMQEHRIIEKVIALFKKELQYIEKTNKIHPAFIEISVDFMQTYTDKCHHGKEEGIFFKALQKKKIADVHKGVVVQLIKEHKFARLKVKQLVEANERYFNKDRQAIRDIIDILNALVKFYPMHIDKEDKQFFFPFINYFTEEEQNNMLNEFLNYDRLLIHEKYFDIVNKMNKLLQKSFV